MQGSLVSNAQAPSQAQCKPSLISLDSSQEFSLDHLAEVCRLIEREKAEDAELEGYVFADSLLLLSSE
jgi:hypothetical protein